MPKRNYNFEKRQKELNRQQKQEEKRQRRRERNESTAPEAGENDEASPETSRAHQGFNDPGERES